MRYAGCHRNTTAGEFSMRLSRTLFSSTVVAVTPKSHSKAKNILSASNIHYWEVTEQDGEGRCRRPPAVPAVSGMKLHSFYREGWSLANAHSINFNYIITGSLFSSLYPYNIYFIMCCAWSRMSWSISIKSWDKETKNFELNVSSRPLFNLTLLK